MGPEPGPSTSAVEKAVFEAVEDQSDIQDAADAECQKQVMEQMNSAMTFHELVQVLAGPKPQPSSSTAIERLMYESCEAFPEIRRPANEYIKEQKRVKLECMTRAAKLSLLMGPVPGDSASAVERAVFQSLASTGLKKEANALIENEKGEAIENMMQADRLIENDENKRVFALMLGPKPGSDASSVERAIYHSIKHKPAAHVRLFETAAEHQVRAKVHRDQELQTIKYTSRAGNAAKLGRAQATRKKDAQEEGKKKKSPKKGKKKQAHLTQWPEAAVPAETRDEHIPSAWDQTGDTSDLTAASETHPAVKAAVVASASPPPAPQPIQLPPLVDPAVEAFLEHLGLLEFIPSFQRCRVSLLELPNLSEEYLQTEIGMNRMGERLGFLKAIRDLDQFLM
jgi:hypothetical protein